MIVLPSCSHTAISAQPGVQRIGEPKMLLNQFICTESPVLVQWYSAGCRCMVYGIADTRKDGLTITIPQL